MDKLTEWIIYEDDILIAVNKPGGLPTQGTTQSSVNNLYSFLQRYLDEREKKSTYLALHHRLDSATSGIIVFCKNQSYNKAFSYLFQNNQITKTYLAICQIKKKKLEPTWSIVNKLITYPFKNHKRSKSSVKGKPAETHFQLLLEKNDLALVQCNPKTGRLHQIRVHLSEDHLPILGDYHYGKGPSTKNLMLHAYKIAFIHPKNKKMLELTAPIPDYFLLTPLG